MLVWLAAVALAVLAPVLQARQRIGGFVYTVNGSGNQPWSIGRGADGALYRFEVRAGERPDWDPPDVERSELRKLRSEVFGQPVCGSYSFMIEPGAPNRARWTALGQFHASPDEGDRNASPPFSLELVGERTLHAMTRTTRDSPLVKNPSPIRRYGITDLARGRWYHHAFAITFDPFGAGALRAWIDGREVANYHDIAIGYPNREGPYWKFGIYREATAETLAVRYANMEVSADCEAILKRVAAPLPVPE
jgi:hypothetical protein